MNGRERPEPWRSALHDPDGRVLLDAARLDAVQARARRERNIENIVSGRRESQRSRRGSWVLALGLVTTLALAGGALWLIPPRMTSTRMAPEPSGSSMATSPPGAPVLYRPACPHIVESAASTALIDDMEDRDGAILPRDARAGTWRFYFDGTGPVVPFAGNLLPVEIPEGRGASQMALHVSGGRLIEWGAFVSAGLTPAGCYDASAYAGIEFWARGTQKLRVGVVMMDVVSSMVGGPCVENCNGGHMRSIELSPEWRRYSLRWAELLPEPANGNIALDLRHLSAVSFGVSPSDTPFDVWLDDLAFLPR